MTAWEDDGIIISSRPHGERSAVVMLFTREHGRHAGVLRSATSQQNRALLQSGTRVRATWKARLSDHLGEWRLEAVDHTYSAFLDQPQKLLVLEMLSQYALAFLPERHAYPNYYEGLLLFLDQLKGEGWHPHYVTLELKLLKELGFALTLQECAVTREKAGLAYVSPKTGCAVTEEVGLPYKDKLLKLPDFLVEDVLPSPSDIQMGLDLTGYFLKKNFGDTHFNKVFALRKRLIESLWVMN
jgi:DNA repair protein RecO (recombination protein O)